MTKTEERILKVWQEVFGREDFGIDDDFFELGGNSLYGYAYIYEIIRRSSRIGNR